jgi:aminoglycoside phosphotransferase family enzyme/predicted kinase
MAGAVPDRQQDSQAEIVAFLADPATHGGAPVRKIETHASVIVLAGEFAYKLKRALRYSYLDYSTAAARRRACEAEVALNRRTAPAIYLRAAPVCRAADGALGIGGDGETVDWLVVMRRFDDDLLFDRLALRQALTLEHMLQLAEEIATFHNSAEIDRQAGGAAAVAEVIDGNLKNLRLHAPAIFDIAAIDRLETRSRQCLARAGDLLDRRRDRGRVRLCHGDLHLRNICLIEGRPVLFDCIEFSRTLACIDVLYDLAFLLMDLEERSLRPLGNAVFNRYLDLMEDDDGVAALPLFLSIRAAVRAHVTAAAASLKTDAAAREGAAGEAREYLRLALALIAPEPPAAVAIGGLSGTGKSTAAYALAPRLGAAPGARVVRSDVLRKRLCGAALTARLPPEAYDEAMTDRVYAALLSGVDGMLAGGHAVIGDAVFVRPEQRAAIERTAARRGVPFVGLWLEAPLATLERRIEGRHDDVSDATVEIVRRQQGYDAGDIGWHRIDAGGSVEAVGARAWAVIRPALRGR